MSNEIEEMVRNAMKDSAKRESILKAVLADTGAEPLGGGSQPEEDESVAHPPLHQLNDDVEVRKPRKSGLFGRVSNADIDETLSRIETRLNSIDQKLDLLAFIAETFEPSVKAAIFEAEGSIADKLHAYICAPVALPIEPRDQVKKRNAVKKKRAAVKKKPAAKKVTRTR